MKVKHHSFLGEGMRLTERLNQERLGSQGKILGVHKSAEVLKLSDRLGVPFFLYFVPSSYFG